MHADLEQDWTIIELSARISFMPPTPRQCRLEIDNSIEVRVVRWTGPRHSLIVARGGGGPLIDLETHIYTHVHTCLYV